MLPNVFTTVYIVWFRHRLTGSFGLLHLLFGLNGCSPAWWKKETWRLFLTFTLTNPVDIQDQSFTYINRWESPPVHPSWKDVLRSSIDRAHRSSWKPRWGFFLSFNFQGTFLGKWAQTETMLCNSRLWFVFFGSCFLSVFYKLSFRIWWCLVLRWKKFTFRK